MLQLVGLFSLLTFLLSLIAVPWLIGRMSPEFFLSHRQVVDARHRRHPLLALGIFILRNGIGFGLLLAGLAMLVLPGQGLLTMLIGVCVMDFPGKHILVERVIRARQVQQALNWIRRKQGKEPFLFSSPEGR